MNINRVAIPVNPYDVFRCDVPNLSTSLYFVVNDTFYDKELPKAHLPEGVYAGGLKAFTEQYPEIASKYYGKAAPSSKDGIIALNSVDSFDFAPLIDDAVIPHLQVLRRLEIHIPGAENALQNRLELITPIHIRPWSTGTGFPS